MLKIILKDVISTEEAWNNLFFISVGEYITEVLIEKLELNL